MDTRRTGGLIRSLREERGLTQLQLAQLVGVGDKAVSKWERAESSPDTGNLIALDGKVVEGEAMVNQSSMTGESMPVVKHEGSFVYAGTVCEEGECVFRVEKTMGGGRYDRIVHMIEESEKLKSTAEDKAARLADRESTEKRPVFDGILKTAKNKARNRRGMGVPPLQQFSFRS